jgi:hypothetical protein
MDELVYITGKYQTSYQHFNEDDTVTEFMDGFMVDVFVPASRVADVDRNDTLRREITAAIKAAIDSVGE